VLARKPIALAAALCCMATTARCASIVVTGTYSGDINGTPLAASVSGGFDTTGVGPNNLTVNFSSIPNDTFTPLALGSSVITLVCWSAAEPIGPDTLNLFGLSGGNYGISRTFSWPTLSGSTLTATGAASTVGSNLSFIANLSGTYNGPTDIVGVTGYTVHWTQGAAGTVDEQATATLLRSNGAALPLAISTVYSGLTNSLLNPEVGSYTPLATYTATGPLSGNFSATWTNTLTSIPEPPSLALCGIGILSLVGYFCGRRWIAV
jgi:hypothetical protein